MHLVSPLKWKTRTLIKSVIGAIVIYFLFFHKRTHHVHYEDIIKNSKSELVGEFVADFSNMMKLNPTLEEFEILEESGDLNHWKYSVHYKEHLKNFPMIKNTGHGHFTVKIQSGNHIQSVASEHQTCFMFGFSCLNSVSEFTFEPNGPDTKCYEKIRYECPFALSFLCHSEVMHQRREIMKNLKKHFMKELH